MDSDVSQLKNGFKFRNNQNLEKFSIQPVYLIQTPKLCAIPSKLFAPFVLFQTINNIRNGQDLMTNK
uniref:Uncharacterized protein n=1 Tax=Romanomermis culicivorax TaxID=13658 RepID=A0A915I2V4_ROMCU